MTLPSSNSAVSSPRYQMFPASSWAYQSKVSSTNSPSCVDRVAHDPSGDAVRDLLRLGRDGHDDLERLPSLVGLRVGPARAGHHRPVGIVDPS